MRVSRAFIWVFLAPATGSFCLIFLYPILQSLYLSFFSVEGFYGGAETFVGLENYQELLRSPLLHTAFRNILVIGVVGGLATFGLAFLFMVLLTSGIRGKAFFRALIYLPNVISVVAITTLWTQYIYNPRYGLLNSFFSTLGLDDLAGIQWTAVDLLLWSMLIAFVWAGVGWFMLILLSGVERIPTDYYEAARLDGATTWQMFTRITLPLLRDVVQVALVTWVILIVNLFGFPKAYTPGTTQRGTITPSIYLYDLVFGNANGGTLDIGKASALAVMLLVSILVVWLMISRVLRRERLEF
jgi:multiple sugar transport system permease protein